LSVVSTRGGGLCSCRLIKSCLFIRLISSTDALLECGCWWRNGPIEMDKQTQRGITEAEESGPANNRSANKGRVAAAVQT